MPKSPHDTAAILVLLGAIFLSGAFLSLARRRFSDTQRAALAERRTDPLLVSALAVSIVGGYYFAPNFPMWAVTVAVLGAAFAAYRLVKHHAGQNYSSIARPLLVVGLALQLGGPVAAVILRAAE